MVHQDFQTHDIQRWLHFHQQHPQRRETTSDVDPAHIGLWNKKETGNPHTKHENLYLSAVIRRIYTMKTIDSEKSEKSANQIYTVRLSQIVSSLSTHHSCCLENLPTPQLHHATPTPTQTSHPAGSPNPVASTC